MEHQRRGTNRFHVKACFVFLLCFFFFNVFLIIIFIYLLHVFIYIIRFYNI
jgi:hypothetical protein